MLLGLIEGEADRGAELMERAARTDLGDHRVLGVPDLPGDQEGTC